MPKIEGYWDCPYCGAKAIKGGIQACPGCGKTRAADTKFYMLDTEHVADESKVGTGPDWFCPYCDSYNPASATVCRNCGHEREATDETYFEMREKQERKAAEEAERAAEATRGPRRSRKPLLLVLLLLIVALVGSCVYRNMPHNKGVAIVDTQWTREITVQENRLVQESGWTLPADAVEQLDAREEIHHYDKELDHYELVEEQRSREVLDGYDTYTTYEDMGNGYFNEVEHSTPRYRTEYYTETHEEPVYVDVPVYATKYYYTIYRWEDARTETAQGQTDPYWPEIAYGANEREGARSESYSVTYADKKGDRTTLACNYDLWSRMQLGNSYTLKIQQGQLIGVE